MIECVSPERAAYLRCKKRNKICIRMAQVLLLVGFFAIWELAAKMNWIDSFLISCPSRMWQTIRDLWTSGDLLLHLGVSCLETVVFLGEYSGTFGELIKSGGYSVETLVHLMQGNII